MNISLIKSYLPHLVCPGLMEAPCTKVSGALLTEENDRLTGLTCAICSISDFADPMFEFHSYILWRHRNNHITIARNIEFWVWSSSFCLLHSLPLIAVENIVTFTFPLFNFAFVVFFRVRRSAKAQGWSLLDPATGRPVKCVVDRLF